MRMGRRIFLSGLSAILALAVPQLATAQINIIPVVSCVTVDASTNVATAYFGWVSLESNTVSIPFGASNFFTPSPPFRNQPTTFASGQNDKSFSVVFPANTTLTWTLNGVAVSASAASPSCGPVCRNVQTVSTATVADVACNAGEILTAGGGRCDNTLLSFPVQWNVGQVQASQMSFAGGVYGWHVECRIGNATASAACCAF